MGANSNLYFEAQKSSSIIKVIHTAAEVNKGLLKQSNVFLITLENSLKTMVTGL